MTHEAQRAIVAKSDVAYFFRTFGRAGLTNESEAWSYLTHDSPKYLERKLA